MTRTALLTALRSSCAEVLAHAALPEADLGRRYAPGKWTVREVLAHVADCEFIYLWRFGRAVCEPGSVVEPFDQDTWARGWDYARRPALLSGALFDGARRLLIHGVETLPDAALARTARHAEKGELTALQWAEISATHSAHHLSQIDAALRGTAWQAAGR